MNAKDVLKRQPVVSICVAVSILAGAIGYWRDSEYAGMKADLVAKEKEGDQLAQNVRNCMQLDAQLEQIAALNKSAMERRIDVADLATNQQYFYTVEAQTGAKITDLRKGTPSGTVRKATASAATVVYNVTAQGDYSHLLAFLRGVESGTRLARITGATLAAQAGPGQEKAPRSPVLNLTLQVEFLAKS